MPVGIQKIATPYKDVLKHKQVSCTIVANFLQSLDSLHSLQSLFLTPYNTRHSIIIIIIPYHEIYYNISMSIYAECRCRAASHGVLIKISNNIMRMNHKFGNRHTICPVWRISVVHFPEQCANVRFAFRTRHVRFVL